MTNLYSIMVITFREYRFVIYWLIDLPVVGYYGGFTDKNPIIILKTHNSIDNRY